MNRLTADILAKEYALQVMYVCNGGDINVFYKKGLEMFTEKAVEAYGHFLELSLDDFSNRFIKPLVAAQRELTTAELNLCREWFNHMQDCTTNYLEPRDYALAKKIHELLGSRVPHSVLRGLGITPDTSPNSATPER